MKIKTLENPQNLKKKRQVYFLLTGYPVARSHIFMVITQNFYVLKMWVPGLYVFLHWEMRSGGNFQIPDQRKATGYTVPDTHHGAQCLVGALLNLMNE